MKIIIGLGNPGKQYENTAHNVGFRVVENLVQSVKFQLRPRSEASKEQSQAQNSKFNLESKLRSEICSFELNKEKVLLAKPVTFMNRSGEAAAAIINFYKINSEELIVIHDDADLPLGKIKVQKGGGSAGHHGIESIIQMSGKSDFTRIRVGIRTGEDKAGEFVLATFKDSEQQTFNEMIKKAAEIVMVILEKGIIAAMNRYNQDNF